MTFNWLIILATGLFPMFFGMLWYSNMLFGAFWKRSIGMDPNAEPENMNMPLIMLRGLVYGLLLAVALLPVVKHNMHLGSMFADDPSIADPNSELGKLLAAVAAKYDNRFSTFKHGAFHGFLSAVFMVLPVMSFSAMFENRGWRYILVHFGFWAVCFAIMGGIICQWG